MNIVVTEPLGVNSENLKNMLEKVIGDNQLMMYPDRKEDIPTLIERCKDADIIVLTNYKLPKEVLEKCSHLKYVCVAFTGYNHVDMDYCNSHGITVTNCAGYSTNAVADLVFGLIVTIYRHINRYNETTRASGTKGSLVNYEMAGKKFGVIGMGTIGQKVAKIADAFDCEVYYSSRNKKDVPYTYLPLEELLKTCDIISVHTAQNADTIDLINGDNIKLMKKNAILINTARGPIVNSKALADALNNDQLLGAGIDVFEMEPPIDPNHPLLTAKNCIVTPHIGFYSKEALEKRAVIVVDNIANYLNGNPTNVVK